MQERNPKYINPYTDFGFKKLFGEKGNKDLLFDFLDQILPAKHQIQEQVKQGNWSFKLGHIYLVAILDFKYDEKEELKKF